MLAGWSSLLVSCCLSLVRVSRRAQTFTSASEALQLHGDHLFQLGYVGCANLFTGP